MKRLKKNLTIEIFLSLFFIIYFFQLPLNFYSISKYNYEKRLELQHGFCENEGYGYMKKVYNKFKLVNVKSYNFKDYPNDSSVFFYKKNIQFDKSRIIILNYDKFNKENNLTLKKLFGNFKIIDNFEDKCFLIEIKN